MKRMLLVAAAGAALAGAAAWGAWTIAALRADERARDLYVQIAKISGKRLEAERQRDELRTALLESRAELAEADRRTAAELASHRAVVTRIEARLRALGQQLEERPHDEPTEALSLGLEAPPGLTLDESWTGWRSCEQSLGAALASREECRETLLAQESLLEAGERIEADLREEIEARQELERQLRRVARRRRVAGRLKLVGAFVAGRLSAQLLD